MKVSILHLSDLHRDLSDELDNEALLESLAVDASQFPSQNPIIQKPDICIVSGDLVYGVAHDRPDYDVELKRQYSQAEEFLIRLADTRFDGNRDRIVIIPGNHDVAFPLVVQSCVRRDIPTNVEGKSSLVGKLFEPHSQLRWSWGELCFHEITDQNAYLSRFQYFAEFYARFYQNTRTFSLEPEQQYDVFDFPDLNLSVAAINSCYENDPFNRAGNIHPRALIEVCRSLRAPARSSRMIVATWHHSLSGRPSQDDYMSSELVQHLIDAGVSLGLHGHQHSAECLDERYRMGPNPRKITIISAGTLCSGPKNLKSGHARGYNIIELDSDAGQGRVHQRRMANDLFDIPIWGPGQFQITNDSFVDFEISAPLKQAPDDTGSKQILIDAEKMIGEKYWSSAIELLKPIKDDPVARTFIVKALQEIDNDDLVIEMLWPPQKVGEIVLVGAAVSQIKDKDRAEKFLELSDVKNSQDRSVLDIVNRIKERVLK